MPEIKPDLSDQYRCVSVHWSLPVQCVLSRTHRENWHEAWDPETGNRLRYRRSFGIFRTEELRNGEWTALFIPPPNEISPERRLARVEEWANSDVVTAKSSFGDGYREAMRDIRDLLQGSTS